MMGFFKKLQNLRLELKINETLRLIPHRMQPCRQKGGVLKTNRVGDGAGKVDDEELRGACNLWNAVVGIVAVSGMTLLDE